MYFIEMFGRQLWATILFYVTVPLLTTQSEYVKSIFKNFSKLAIGQGPQKNPVTYVLMEWSFTVQ